MKYIAQRKGWEHDSGKKPINPQFNIIKHSSMCYSFEMHLLYLNVLSNLTKR